MKTTTMHAFNFLQNYMIQNYFNYPFSFRGTLKTTSNFNPKYHFALKKLNNY